MVSAISQGNELKQADGTYRALAKLNQAKDDWDTNITDMTIGGVNSSDSAHWLHTPKAKGTCAVIFNPADGSTTIDWDYTGGSSGTTPIPTPTPDDITNANNGNIETANSIFHTIYRAIGGEHQTETIHVDNNTQIIVTVKPDGSLDFQFDKLSGNANTVKDQIITALGELINDEGKVAFYPLGEYEHGYKFTIKHNNGQNKPSIEKLP